MQILVATTNKHKAEEIKSIFFNENIKFSSLIDYDKIPPAVEDGSSFLENATIKAMYYFKYLQMPVIADDSGLVVPALNDQPGVHSARYAGDRSDYSENNKRLLENMANLQGEDRKAHFICVVVYYDGQNLISAEGRADGIILHQPSGQGGFGYDPLFFYRELGRTFAELPPEEKNKVSHRSKALSQLKEKLGSLIMNNS